MDIHQIQHEVKTSKWQPKFKLSDDIADVANMINLGHEDYPINISETINIIDMLRGSEEITWQMACNIQKRLFDKKKEYCDKKLAEYRKYQMDGDVETNNKLVKEYIFVKGLPNMYINMGIRDNNVKVGNWSCPRPLYLNTLKSRIFPIGFDTMCNLNPHEFGNCMKELTGNSNFGTIDVESILKLWYKLFQTIHPFNDLNGRVGGIIIAVLSKSLIGQYLTLNKI